MTYSQCRGHIPAHRAAPENLDFRDPGQNLIVNVIFFPESLP